MEGDHSDLLAAVRPHLETVAAGACWALYAADESGDRLRLISEFGAGPDGSEPPLPLEAWSVPAAAAAAARDLEPRFLGSAAAIAAQSPLAAPGAGAFAAVPVASGELSFGVLCLIAPGEIEFTPPVRALLLVAARYLAEALLTHRLNETTARSERWYRNLLAQSTEGIAVFNSSFTIIEANAALERLFRAPGGGLDGLSGLDLLPAAGRTQGVRDFRELCRRGQAVFGERSFRRRDDTTFTAECTAGVIRIGGDNLFLFFFRDLSARKQMEQALLLLSRAVSTTADGIFVADLENRVQFCNESYAGLFGASPAEMTGRDPLTPFAPDQRRAIGRAIADLKDAGTAAPATLWRGEVSGHGQRPGFTGELTLSAVQGEGGGFGAVIGVLRDTTETRKLQSTLADSESKLRSLLEAVPDQMFAVDRDFRLTWANRVLLERFDPEVVGRRCYNIFHTRREICPRCAVQQTFADGQRHSMMRETVFPDGSKRDYLIVSVPLTRDEPGRITTVLEVARDITEFRTLQTQLLHAEKMAAMGILAGGIAHEFNNLHGGIQGYVELILQTRELDDETREDLDLVRKTVHRASEITRQLLTFARKSAPQRKPALLSAIVEDTLRLVKKEFETAGVQVVSRHDGSVPELVVDSGQLGQVVMNLAINARHAMEGRSPRILAVETGREGPRAFIRVQDTGCGIAAADRENIFDPFFTTKGSLAGSRTPGTGLGLSVSYTIVREHGGAIEVESEEDHGATFTVWLPCEPAPEPAREEPLAEIPVVAQARILVVDDERIIRDLLGRMLTMKGYEVETAASGLEGLDRVNNREYDAVLVDLQIPDLPGKNILAAVSQLAPERRPAALVITGKASDEVLKDTEKYGARAVLRKPFEFNDVFWKIYEAICENRPTAALKFQPPEAP